MTDDELYLYLAPYCRADGKIEYSSLLQETFPGSYTPEMIEIFQLGVVGEGTIIVPRIGGKPDRVKYNIGVSKPDQVKQHVEVRNALQEAVKNWDPDVIDEAITMYGHHFPPAVIKSCVARKERLTKKRNDCAQALARGTISIDEKTR